MYDEFFRMLFSFRDIITTQQKSPINPLPVSVRMPHPEGSIFGSGQDDWQFWMECYGRDILRMSV